jgi:alpha-glucuronidase
LWFHHLPWDYEVSPGKTLWAELVEHYDRGVDSVAALRVAWDALDGKVDSQRYEKTKALLAIQEREAKWWRDACLAYFQSVSGLPLPAGAAAPPHSLEYYESIRFPHLAGY